MAMDVEKLEYIYKHYRKKTARQIAKDLQVSRSDVNKAIAEKSKSGYQRAISGFQANVKPQKTKRWVQWLALSCVILGAFLVYLKSLSFPFMNWDDPVYVIENSLIRSFSVENLWKMFFQPYFIPYVPVTLLSYTFDYQWYGLEPAGFRLTNIFIHLMNGILVYGLVKGITKDWIIGIAAAALFVVHPVQIESVVWISERKNVLSGLFFLLSLFAYTNSYAEDSGRNYGVSASFFFFILGCFAKPSIVVLPALLMTFDLCFGHYEKRRMPVYLLFFGIALIFVAANLYVASVRESTEAPVREYGVTLITMFVVMIKYLKLMLFPLHQSILYVFPLYSTFLHPHVIISLILCFLMLGLCVFLWARSKDLFFWFTWYFILLLPVMQIVPIPGGGLMQERYLYLALIGFFVFLFLCIKQRIGMGLTIFVLSLFLSGFIFLNLRRQDTWATPEALWEKTKTSMEGEHSSPYHNMGMQYLRQKRPDMAIPEFEKAIAVLEDPQSYNGLGLAYEQKGDYEEAVRNYELAIRMKPQDAGFHNNLSIVYKAQEKYELSLEEIRTAITLDPDEPEYHNNLGTLLAQMKIYAESEKAFLRALDIDLEHADSLYNLGMVYFVTGELEKAQITWESLLKAHPRYQRIETVKKFLEKVKLLALQDSG